jgi:NADPH-dependent ferric siderophore reductase
VEWQPPAAVPSAPVRVLLAGDETALPAISAIVESLPAGYHGHVLVEIPYEADATDLRSRGDLEVTWLPRAGRPGAASRPHGQRLREAAAALLLRCPLRRSVRPAPAPEPETDIDAEVLWETPSFLGLAAVDQPDPCYAWVAGEAAVVRDLRRLLVHQHGLDRASVAFMGYWRQGRAELC